MRWSRGVLVLTVRAFSPGISKQSLKENGLDAHVMNEKAIMMGLEHPFINRFYCEMEDDVNLYFLLEALPGGELCKRLREESSFPESTGKFYSASVLFAFCHMHAKKIAYRDLKPENLVMDSVGYVKVVDFGLAKVRHVWAGAARDAPGTRSSHAVLSFAS